MGWPITIESCSWIDFISLTNQQPFRHALFLHDLHLFFPFHVTWQKGFLCHRSTTLEFTPSWYPEFEFSTSFPFQAQNTPLQNCIPSLGSFPSSWTVYPDFDSCYSHCMPYRMTPSVRHRAIEVHYYYYYSVAYTRWYRRTQRKAATINQLACPRYSLYVQLLCSGTQCTTPKGWRLG